MSCVRREPAVGPGSRVSGAETGQGRPQRTPRAGTAPAVAPRPFTSPCKRRKQAQTGRRLIRTLWAFCESVGHFLFL